MAEDVKKIIQTIKNGELPPLESPAPPTSGSNIHSPEWNFDFIKRAFEAFRLAEASADEKIKIALEKQTPRKVKIKGITFCPVCSTAVNSWHLYCHHCGQRLDLSEIYGKENENDLL